MSAKDTAVTPPAPDAKGVMPGVVIAAPATATSPPPASPKVEPVPAGTPKAWVEGLGINTPVKPPVTPDVITVEAPAPAGTPSVIAIGKVNDAGGASGFVKATVTAPLAGAGAHQPQAPAQQGGGQQAGGQAPAPAPPPEQHDEGAQDAPAEEATLQQAPQSKSKTQKRAH